MPRPRTAVPAIAAVLVVLAVAPAAGAGQDNVYVYRVTGVSLHGTFSSNNSWGQPDGEHGSAHVEATTDVSWAPPKPDGRPTRRSGAWVGWWGHGRFDGRLATRTLALRWAGTAHREEQAMDYEAGALGPVRADDCGVAFTERRGLVGAFTRGAEGTPAIAMDLPTIPPHTTCLGDVGTRAITIENELTAPRVAVPAVRLRGPGAFRIPVDARFATKTTTLRYTGTITLRRAWSCRTPPERQCNASLTD